MLAEILRRLEAIEATQVEILRRIRDDEERKRPALTQRAFAAMVNLHPKTVGRMIKAGKLRTQKGRIPHSELAKYLS